MLGLAFMLAVGLMTFPCLAADKSGVAPGAISLPSGQALQFAKRMENFIDLMRARLPREFEDKPYQNQQAALKARFEEKKAQLWPMFLKESRPMKPVLNPKTSVLK